MSIPMTYQVTAKEPPEQTRPVILLVDDDPMVREITRQTLEHAGYQVLEATGPSHALELMAQKKRVCQVAAFRCCYAGHERSRP
jgi:CheY-like chemotaxis protein